VTTRGSFFFRRIGARPCRCPRGLGFEHVESLWLSVQSFLIPFPHQCGKILRTRMNDLANWSAACCAPTTSRLGFRGRHASGFLGGIRQVCGVERNTIPGAADFSFIEAKSMFGAGRFGVPWTLGQSQFARGVEADSGMRDRTKSRDAREIRQSFRGAIVSPGRPECHGGRQREPRHSPNHVIGRRAILMAIPSVCGRA